MNCRDLEELLSAYADGELSRTQREFIEGHLADCADCRATLADFVAAGRRLSSLREVPAGPDLKEATMLKIRATSASSGKSFRRWLRPVTATVAIVAVIAVLLVTQPWGMKSPEAMAASIVRNSPEVQAALNGEEIKEVEVTTSVVDDEGNVLMMLVKTEERAVATRVDLETKQVTEIVRVNVPDFQPGDNQKALDIARADSRVQELLSQGGVIGEVHLGRSIDIEQVTGPDGVVNDGWTVTPTASLSIDLEGKQWNITIDLPEGKVHSIGRSQPSSAMIVVHISRFVTRFVAPVLLFLGILLVSGLSFGYRRTKTIAGTAALALGIIGLFMALYSLSSIWWRLVLSVGIPAVGLIIGITDIRQRLGKRWMPIAGIVLGSLALLLVFLNAIMLNINNVVPGENIVRVIGIAAVIAGIIAYALYEQIRRIPRKCWRPALIVGVAAIILVLALVQPWSVNPQGIIAKAYSATEGLLSYRTSSSLTYTYKGKATIHSSEWEYVAPDRGHGRLNLDSEAFEFIIIGDKQYVREPDGASGNLFSVAVSISGSTHSKEETLRVLDSLVKIENLPDERIAGTDCLHLRGEVDLQRRAEKAKAGLDPTDPRYEDIIRSIDEQIASGEKEEVEVWIGKEDHLIRQVKHEGQSPSGDGSMDTFSVVVKYYDFNKPIIIEPPLDSNGNLLPGWSLAASYPAASEQAGFLKSDAVSTIGGEDPAYQRISYDITITNVGELTASNVRVKLLARATNDESGAVFIDAEPSTPAPVDIGPGESETYSAGWEYDASYTNSEKLARLLRYTWIFTRYTLPEGVEDVQASAADIPYPLKNPPTPELVAHYEQVREQADYPIYVPTNLPEGLELSQFQALETPDGDRRLVLTYGDPGSRHIELSQQPFDMQSVDDLDLSGYSTFSIMATPGYWKEDADNTGRIQMLWDRGDMTYQLTARNVPIEELMVFAASIVRID